MPGVTPEVAVVGCGPAGCAAARLLAEWRHRVELIGRPSRERRPLAESIPPSGGAKSRRPELRRRERPGLVALALEGTSGGVYDVLTDALRA